MNCNKYDELFEQITDFVTHYENCERCKNKSNDMLKNFHVENELIVKHLFTVAIEKLKIFLK